MQEANLPNDAVIHELQARYEATLASPEFVKISEIATSLGLGPLEIKQLVATAASEVRPGGRLVELAEACTREGVPPGDFGAGRFALLTAGLPNLERVTSLPVASEVKHRLLDWFLYPCAPDREMAQLLAPASDHFSVMCKLVRLERFPGGQVDWEISGFPRSWLTKVPLADVPKLAYTVFLRAGGHRPFFEAHTSSRRPLPIVSAEEERKDLRAIAMSMKLQPEIRGYLGSSWFSDPELPKVSPHMAWVSELYREFVGFGAVWTYTGEASPDSGYLVGDRRRRKLYEQGLWKPKQGLIVWARKDLLRWFATQG